MISDVILIVLIPLTIHRSPELHAIRELSTFANFLDCALDNGLCFWVCGDQLLKGAALNAVQIAEELVK